MIAPVESSTAHLESSQRRPLASSNDGIMFEVVRPGALSGEQLDCWENLLSKGLQQETPFLHPEFTKAVAAIRGDVEVAMLRQNKEIVGFFPFQRGTWNIGKPVGGRLSSYQGLVVRDDIEWSAEEVIRGCKLAAWNFDQLDLSQVPFERHAKLIEGAAYLDLSEGYDAYRESRRSTGSQRIIKTESLARKLEREAGPVRFEFHSHDFALVKTLMGWKSAQFRETGLEDVFAHSWTGRLLETLLERHSPTFAPAISALYAGDRPVAISYALRTKRVLHGMFIGFDREFSKYSPGLVLLLSIAKEAAQSGIQRFQLGSGGDHYKQSLASGETRVAAGSVECRPMAKLIRRGFDAARRAAHTPALASIFEGPLRLLRPLRERRSFR